MSSLLIPYVKPHFTPQLIEIEAELNSFQAYISTPAELQNNVARAIDLARRLVRPLYFISFYSVFHIHCFFL